MGISFGGINSGINGYGYTTGSQYDNGLGSGLGVSSSEKIDRTPGMQDKDEKIHGQEECQTCKNRKYQDGSDEMVSFKTAQHIAPESAAARVRAHEQEHVSNAYKEAAQNDGKVIRASVSIHMGVCPECGRTYVAGGVTDTQIKYNNEKNPYERDKKAIDYGKVAGANAEYDV